MKRIAVALLAGASLIGAASAAFAAPAKPVKLPKTLATAIGNTVTLYAYDAPSSKHTVASVQVEVCASSHTPKDTAVDPAFFTLKLTNGSALSMASTAAHAPPLAYQPLRPNQCSTKGWLSFDVPSGKSVAALDYTYKTTLSWSL